MTSTSKPQPASITRADRIAGLRAASNADSAFDVLVVGGGATGLGVAVDAAQRGLKVALIEGHDYAKGTSSRASKLLHGGVRYLAQGNIALVREALHERTALLSNAPEVATALPFVMPSYRWYETFFYGVGLKLYDLLAGRAGLGATRFLGSERIRALSPNVKPHGLNSGVQYWDAQFDDARLAFALAMTAQTQGAVLLNHAKAIGLIHDGGRVCGAIVQDAETLETFSVSAKCVINATGIWVDELRGQDAAALKRPMNNMVAPSQGVHLVVDAKFWPGDNAMLVPKTADGRVLFVIPWLGSVILGTTDTPREQVEHEPQARESEIDFILTEAANYLAVAPKRSDVKSIWVGMRPLVKPSDEDGSDTKVLSREHTILVSKSGLLTVTGGKWTTYRAMAEDVMARAGHEGLVPKQASETAKLRLNASASIKPAKLTAADVQHMATHEHARTVEDVLARRCRALFLDARQAAQMAPWVADTLKAATGTDPKLAEFLALAKQYLIQDS